MYLGVRTETGAVQHLIGIISTRRTNPGYVYLTVAVRGLQYVLRFHIDKVVFARNVDPLVLEEVK